MREAIVQYAPWFLSALSVYMMFLMGDKNAKGWSIAILNQALWLIWIVSATAWGFLPLNIGMWWVSIRGFTKWKEGKKQ